MPAPLAHIGAISLFVEDLAAARQFYQDVFEVEIVYADAVSVAVRFEPNGTSNAERAIHRRMTLPSCSQCSAAAVKGTR